ncbi:GNAT family N-acetyltransferase [Canibacter zhoujuaniae]|uniref:GNAT family N-acetyltransferase n=1 Tax=Canibacter zhoujuaniae TaxID=2708343 RepID=UPI0014216535|nr:GNAT family N-acetyltransferase [Canibacter zhoujuaniae]
MSELRLEELSASTIVAVNRLSLKPGQEQFITPVSYAAALAVTPANTAWQRVAVRDDRVVGFIHANFDAENSRPEFRAALWRINVDAKQQGTGVGTFIVNELIKEARSRGIEKLTVLYEAGDEGPEQFFLNVGFKPEGETEYGEIIAAYDLTSA